MVDDDVLPGIVDAHFLAERQALRNVLQSPLFQRAPNLSKVLEFICEQYFAGEADRIKEYSIAVEALGRSAGFDPQIDAIVRVDLYLLRKRLHAYYAHAGKRDPLHIILRPGSYVPEFLRAGEARLCGEGLCSEEAPPAELGGFSPYAAMQRAATKLHHSSRLVRTAEQPPRKRAAWRVWAACAGCALLGLAAGLLATLAWTAHSKPSILFTGNLPTPAQAVAATFLRDLHIGSPPDSLLQGIRIRCGSSKDYVDSAGLRWLGDRDFTGGSAFARPVAAIQRSTDPALYSYGRQGVFQYNIPVAPGDYEVHLFFAETQPGIRDGMRQVVYTVGFGKAETTDIAADAEGEDAAVERVYADVRPGDDGKIHLNFLSTDSLLNAIEVLPEINGKPQPVRISTLHTLYQDTSGGHWLPDRFYRGGVNIGHEFVRSSADSPLFERERYGNFDYVIPVAKGYTYQLTLFMAESYWGTENSGLGGIGSRIFTVRCNGIDLLSDFDLLAAEDGHRAVAIRFRGLKPNAAGQLRLDFVTEVNYPLINAIEVQAE